MRTRRCSSPSSAASWGSTGWASRASRPLPAHISWPIFCASYAQPALARICSMQNSIACQGLRPAQPSGRTARVARGDKPRRSRGLRSGTHSNTHCRSRMQPGTLPNSCMKTSTRRCKGAGFTPSGAATSDGRRKHVNARRDKALTSRRGPTWREQQLRIHTQIHYIPTISYITYTVEHPHLARAAAPPPRPPPSPETRAPPAAAASAGAAAGRTSGPTSHQSTAGWG